MNQNTISKSLARNRLDSRDGFSVIEIMLVAVIVAILAALAIPAFQKIREHSNVSKFASDLRILSGQFEGYHFSNARWPVSTDPGELPPEMEGYVSDRVFSQPNAVGGQWMWYDDDETGIGVSYGGTDRELVLYRSIAERIDDGDLFTGRFKLVDANTVVWILDN